MRKSRTLLIGLALLLCLIPVLLVSSFNALEHYQLRRARNGLEAVKAKLTTPGSFELITTVSTDFPGVNLGTCYYARDYLIMGTTLTETQALDMYENHLRSVGWLPGERQYLNTRVFYSGDNVFLVVTTIGPGDDTRDAVDYERLKQEYESVVFVRLEFQLPSTSEC